jgi:hypothetical protein
MVRRAWLLIAVLLIGVSPVNAEVRAYVDRAVIADNETLELTIESSEGFDEPALDALRMSFDVLGTVRGSHMQIVRGKVESKQQLVLTLAPRQAGDIRIPALKVGDEHTAPISVRVVSAAGDPKAARGDVLVEVAVEPRSAMVQEQVIVTINLFHAVQLSDGKLTVPNLPDAVVERLGDDETREELRAGRRYKVVTRRLALFPQASGTLRIPPVEFSGQALVRSGRSMNSFFSNPFGADPLDAMFAQAKPVRARSGETVLAVSSKPPDARGPWWLPARALGVTETWSPATGPYRIGEPVTRTIVMQADGLTPAQLPELPLQVPDGVKHYPDQAANETKTSAAGLTAIRTQKVAYVATQPGTVTLPRIEVEWWNTASRQMERATLPARDIVFAPAADGGGSAPVGAAPRAADSAAAADSPGEWVDDAAPRTDAAWRYVATAAFAAWVMTLLAWWWWTVRRRGVAAADGTGTSSGVRRKSASAGAVRAACKSGDAAQLRDELLKFGATRWADAPPKSLGELAERVTDSAVREVLWSVEQRLYKPAEGAAPLAESAAVLEKWIDAERDSRPVRRSAEGLKALYPER